MNNIYLLIGKSGSGKSTIAKMFEERYGYKVLKSYTTREQRNFKDNDHIFITKEQYEHFNEEDMVAYTYFDNNHYFATKEQVDNADIYIIDIGGLIEIKQNYKGKKNIKTIYIDVAVDILSQRMIQRGDSLLNVKQRIRHDEENFDTSQIQFDLVVSNNTDDVEDVFVEIQRFIALNECCFPEYKKIVYLSHPYSNKISNKTKLEKFQKYLIRKYPGYLFLSPIHAFGHLYDDVTYEEGLNYCLFLLNISDEIWMLGDWTNSKGCQKEVQVAIKDHLPIKFISKKEYEEVVND